MDEVFDPILERMKQFLSSPRFVVAYSGGRDSSVLLHLVKEWSVLAGCSDRVVSIHIHHGLHAEADAWEAHCENFSNQLGIPFHCIHVTVDSANEKSIEENARIARYHAFETFLRPQDCLLLAHHRRDQVETVLMRFCKGAGVTGLSGMPFTRPIGNAVLVRPLLEWSDETMESYAKKHHLNFIQDPSNFSLAYDRNFIRQEILPRFLARWPSIETTLIRSSKLCHEVSKINEVFISKELGALKKNRALDIKPLLDLEENLRWSLLRGWLKELTDQYPSLQVLQELDRSVIHAKKDAKPLLQWMGQEFRRYHDKIWCVNKLSFSETQSLPIQWGNPLLLPNGKGIHLIKTIGSGISEKKLKVDALSIRFRQGGESFHPAGRVHAHPLKKLMQEWDIPPWERYHLPLLYQAEELIAVMGYGYASHFSATADEPGYVLVEKQEG